jgi:hypothetical protein
MRRCCLLPSLLPLLPLLPALAQVRQLAETPLLLLSS